MVKELVESGLLQQYASERFKQTHALIVDTITTAKTPSANAQSPITYFAVVPAECAESWEKAAGEIEGGPAWKRFHVKVLAPAPESSSRSVIAQVGTAEYIDHVWDNTPQSVAKHIAGWLFVV